MTEDTCKSLLFKFYGLDSERKKVKNLSSSKGIENFENIIDSDETTEQLILTEETGKNQNDVDDLDAINDENKDSALSKSPHVLTITDLLSQSKEDLQEPNSELDISSDFNEKVAVKTSARLEDTVTRTVTKITDVPVKNDYNTIENSANIITTASVSKAKRIWRQKTINQLKENTAIDLANMLSKCNGVFLDLNYMGITDFPADMLHQLKNLQMLYLDSNNLKEIPADLFIILKKLKWLDVRNNHLTTLPETIKGHDSLETLLLQGNNIEKLPLELGLVPNLKKLQTAYNPLVFPPQEILELDIQSILNYLRQEWNKQHADEQIELQKISRDKVDKKPSTIICYQPLDKNLQKNYKYHNLSASKSSVRARTWNYKPSSRCNSALDFTYQQKQLWKNTAKKILSDQTAELQKFLDKNVLAQWKSNYRAFKNKKISSNSLKEPPFALHVQDSREEIHRAKIKKKLEYKYDVQNFNENCKSVQQSLQALNDAKLLDDVTPRSKQLKIRTEIDTINDLRKNINDLKLCTDLFTPKLV